MKQLMASCLVLAALCGDLLLAQAPTTQPKTAIEVEPAFEVATIKPSRPEEKISIVVRGRQFLTTASSLYDLITYAYRLHARQIINGPGWLEAEKYDVTAQPSSEVRPNGEQLRVMVQQLLADRFRLKFHRDKKELSVFTIAIAKDGIKMVQSKEPNGAPGTGFNGSSGTMIVKSATISDFANFMQRYVMDRPVVDQTQLAGKYDFTLNWTPNESQFQGRAFDPADQASDAADLFTAIQQQLGLKLESAKVPVEVLVIDSVEKPSDN